MYVPELVHLTSGIAGVDYLGGYTSHGRGGGGGRRYPERRFNASFCNCNEYVRSSLRVRGKTVIVILKKT